jgi:error-prone DNA polymerase
MAVVPDGLAGVGEAAVAGAAESRSTRPVVASPPGPDQDPGQDPAAKGPAGGMGRRRVLVHSSGFKVSPYADIKPAGDPAKDVSRNLWHRSPGSPG